MERYKGDDFTPVQMCGGKSIGYGDFKKARVEWEIPICDAVVFQDSTLAFSANCCSAYSLD
jgi:hypothetical protein